MVCQKGVQFMVIYMGAHMCRILFYAVPRKSSGC